MYERRVHVRLVSAIRDASAQAPTGQAWQLCDMMEEDDGLPGPLRAGE